MSDNHDFLRSGRDGKSALFADTLALMTRGAGYALVLCVFLGVLWFATVGVAALLPPESKDQPDPTPLSRVAPTETTTVSV